jgi:SAM-dependent methyltransferase
MASIYTLIRPLQRRFRRKRMEEFVRLFRLTPETRVLDVGGTSFNWELCPVRPCVTLVNVQHETAFEVPDDMELVLADGRSLPFKEGGFDIVYCNSVIEHVGSFGDQVAFAREIARVGRRYYCQTPAQSFPIEPHLIAPAIHWLPRSMQATLIPFTPYGLTATRSAGWLDWYDSIRLVTRKEMCELFPDAILRIEKFAGLTKSYVAVRV